MDPDMVRQQAEAEREALELLRKRPAPASIPHAVPAGASGEAAPVVIDEAPALASIAQATAAAPEAEPHAPRLEQGRRRSGLDAAAQLGRAFSFGLAGAMLGGGLGILAANYMQLSTPWTNLAIYGPAAIFAGACAAASFYAKTFHE